VIQLLLFGDETTEDDIKCKNIRQTEILVDLREAVLQAGRHFMSLDPKLSRLSLQVCLYCEHFPPQFLWILDVNLHYYFSKMTFIFMELIVEKINSNQQVPKT
jgi:hypothetical protein